MVVHTRRISGIVLTALMCWFFSRSVLAGSEVVSQAPYMQERSDLLAAASLLATVWVVGSIIYGGILAYGGTRFRAGAVILIGLQVLMGVCVYLALRDKGYSIGIPDLAGMAVLVTPPAVALLDFFLPDESPGGQSREPQPAG